jgi:anion-transporting  ArsA/GET3 family ATPase
METRNSQMENEGECRDQLCWCLDGKASEMYALLVERNQDMAYKDLIIKIEKQFGFRELPETAQVQFSNARQTPEELLEDRADRVLSLATRAYRALPEKHMYQQAVVRFCQGAADKEAGSYASNIRPKNIEEAIDKMRWHQHKHQAIYVRPPRREVKQVSPGLTTGRGGQGSAS